MQANSIRMCNFEDRCWGLNGDKILYDPAEGYSAFWSYMSVIITYDLMSSYNFSCLLGRDDLGSTHCKNWW